MRNKAFSKFMDGGFDRNTKDKEDDPYAESVRVRRNCFPFHNGSDPVLGVVRLFIFAVGSHRWLKPNWSW